jgi:tetratricopeptide (TPR) repeat protein
MEGRFDAARELLDEATVAREELGLTLHSAVSHHAAIVELLAGDPLAAERSLRAGYAALEAMGERGQLSTTAAFIGQALLAQGRDDEAERLAATSAVLTTDDDILTQALWRGVRARALAGRGRAGEAEGLAREAVALARRTDFLNHEADAIADLALVLHANGRSGEARAATEEALALYERKGNLVAAQRARTRLVAMSRV